MNFKLSSAVCTGRRHLEAGLPCQDRVFLCRKEGRVCAALADGAGSRENSHLGAACVTRCTAELLCRDFDRLWGLETWTLGRELTEHCLRELARLEPPIDEMASTLLFFAAGEDGRYLAGHLGDGLQVLVPETGEPRVFSAPENGEYLNETVFLTSTDAAEHLRLYRGTLTAPGALLLMSDGVEGSLLQRSTGVPAPACRILAQWLGREDEETMDQILEENLRQVFAAHTGDDLSLIVAAWSEGI